MDIAVTAFEVNGSAGVHFAVVLDDEVAILD